MIVTAIPSDRDQTYAIVKKLLYCGDNPVPSQVSDLSMYCMFGNAVCEV